MSAWIVTKKHVAAIVRYADRCYKQGRDLKDSFPACIDQPSLHYTSLHRPVLTVLPRDLDHDLVEVGTLYNYPLRGDLPSGGTMFGVIRTKEPIPEAVQAQFELSPVTVEPPPWPVYWCNKLMVKNVDSVNHRYSDHPPEIAQPITYLDLKSAPDLSVVELLKAIHCLQYQSCEQDDYYDTIEYKFLRRLHDGVIHELPGYDQAPWGID